MGMLSLTSRLYMSDLPVVSYLFMIGPLFKRSVNYLPLASRGLLQLDMLERTFEGDI